MSEKYIEAAGSRGAEIYNTKNEETFESQNIKEDVYPVVKKITTRNGKQRLHAIICDSQNKGNNSKPLVDFSDVPVSMITIVATTNLNIDADKFLEYIPVTDYVITKKKRGRKKKNQPDDPNRDIPIGSVITLEKGDVLRGVALKIRNGTDKPFKHAVSATIVIERDKKIHVKISKNGTFHLAGCKSIKHAVECVKHFYSLMIETEEWTGETIFTYKSKVGLVDETEDSSDEYVSDTKNEEIETNGLTAIFRAVMVNLDWNMGYKIHRKCLHKFITFKTDDFRSIYEASLRPSVTIKIKMNDGYDEQLNRLQITSEGTIIEDTILFSEYYNALTEKQKKDLNKKNQDKYHTFLVFASGSIIMSTAGKEMAEIFYRLIRLLINNRKHIEDKEESNVVIDSSWIEKDQD